MLKKQKQTKDFEETTRNKKEYIPPQLILTYREDELVSEKAYCESAIAGLIVVNPGLLYSKAV